MNKLLSFPSILLLSFVASSITCMVCDDSKVKETQQKEQPMLYDTSKVYERNIVELSMDNVHPVPLPPKEKWRRVLGYDVATPFGIPACPISLSSGVKFLSKLGFSVFTYKTIRSESFKAHPAPNVCLIPNMKQLSYADNKQPIHALEDAKKSPSIACSIGNACLDIEWVKEDIARARSYLQEGQLLIVSVYGVASEMRAAAQDFAYTALMAQKAGAQAIELNLSCPNVNGGLLYLQSDKVYEIVSTVCTALKDLPVIIKVGAFPDEETLNEIMFTAMRAGARGVCSMNCLPMQIITAEGKPVFGKRIHAGVSGGCIKDLALEQLHFLLKFKEKWAQSKMNIHHTECEIFSTGGVASAADLIDRVNCGAQIAMSATGVINNPYLAQQALRNKLFS